MVKCLKEYCSKEMHHVLTEKVKAARAGKLVPSDIESIIGSIIQAHDSSFIAGKVIVYV